MKYPENTIASFLAAVLYGADGVELDVWLSSDGVPVVIHDRSTGRVAGVDVDVKKTSVGELKKLHLGLGQTIPSLEEVFKALPYDTLVAIEIKDVDAVEPVYELVRKYNLFDRIFIISFIVEALERMHSLDPKIRLGLNIDSLDKAQRAIEMARDLGLYSINPPIQGIEVVGINAFKNYLKTVKSIGCKVMLWTVNDPKVLADLNELYDVVITDNVETLVKTIRSIE